MKVLVACEYSGIVRDAFIALGHDAMSCDLLPTEHPGPHYMGDVFDVIDYPWGLMIAHPPCTHLSVSGARHFAAKRIDGRQQEAVSFFMRLIRRSEHIKRTAIENPVCIMSGMYRKPDQIIQPWQFGHGETKATCLWLKGLPPLCRRTSSAGAMTAYTRCRRVLTDGKSAVKRTKALRTPLPHSGAFNMRSWEQRESARTGKPVPQVLAELIEQSGGKLEAMGMMAGMTYQAAHRMLVRNGIRKTPILHFEFRGMTAALTSHCKTHGLNYYSVKEYARRNKVSRADALERYLSGQVRPYRNGVAACG